MKSIHIYQILAYIVIAVLIPVISGILTRRLIKKSKENRRKYGR